MAYCRLLKAIRHDAPDVETTRKRLGVADGNAAVVQVMKTIHTAHGGKLSISRILSGTVADSAELWLSANDTAKVSGIYRMLGKDQSKLAVGQGRRYGGARQARRGQDRADADLGQGRHGAAGRDRAAAAGLCLLAAAQGAQGRSEDVGGDPAPGRGRPLADAPPQPGFRRNGAVRPWRDASARHRRAAGRQEPDPDRGPPAGRPLPRDDPQDRRASAAATRSSPAATASSATW